jgi:hypothetical protein
MALKVLITEIDTNNTAKSFGIVGSVLLNASDVKKAITQVAANDDAVNYKKPELNSKKLVAVIDQLSIMDNLLKQKLDNQKIAYQNSKLAEQEDRIERVRQLGNLGAKNKDAERVGGTGLGLLALAGLGLLAYDPVMNAIKSIVDFVVETGTFVSDTVNEITEFFEGFFPDNEEPAPEDTNSQEITPAAAPASSLREQAEVASLNPVTPDAQPIPSPAKTEGPSLREQAEAAAIVKPSVSGTKSKGSQPKDNRSWWERSAPSWAGGKPVPIPSATPANQGKQEKTDTLGKVAEVSHPDTGSGWGINGGKDSNGRPVVFSKEAAMAFAQMMKDSGGLVKPSDVTSSKRTVAYQEDMKKRGYKPASNSLHLSGIGLDIHGSSQSWIKQHGHKYGWQLNDYSGSHGGHFDYRGPGVALPAEQGVGGGDQQSIVGQVTSKATKMVDDTLTNMAKFIGTIGGKIVGRGTARDLTTAAPDFAKLISNEAATQTAEIAKIKNVASKPTPTVIASPPNISAPGASTVQNTPTMGDRNSVQYYLDRFGYRETNNPIKAIITS